MAAIYTTLFWCALQVTLFLLLAAPIYFLVRRRSPQAATFAAATSLAAVIALSALAASPWPRWTLAFDGREGVAVAAGSPTAAASASEQQGASKQPNANMPLAEGAAADVESPLTALWQAVQFAATPAALSPSEGAQAAERRPQWPAFLAVLFLVGASISGVRLVAGLIAVRKLQAGSQSVGDAALATELHRLCQELRIVRPVSLLESAEIATPATVGWRRPAILLPPAWRTWDAVERRAVLAHELAHISQHDFAAWLIARAAIAVHFYHPLVRWFAGRLQLDQELAADAAAVRLVGDRDGYLQALASVSLGVTSRQLMGPAQAFVPNRSLLTARVAAIRCAKSSLLERSSWLTMKRRSAALALSAFAMISVGFRPAVSGDEPGASLASAEETPAFTSVSGKVVDAEGAVVPHALVICKRAPFHGGDVETVADDQGRFRFKLAHPIDRREVLDTWAYAKGHAFRTVNLRMLNVMAPTVENVLIMLPPPERISFKVNLPSIEPAVGVMVAPRLVSIPNGFYSADEPTGLSAWVPKRLAAVLSAPVGEDGMVAFDAIPRKLAKSFRIETPEYGIQEFSQFEDEVRLAPVGRVDGQIETSKPEDLAGRTVYVESAPTDRNVPKLTREGNAQTVVDKTGRFAVPAIVEGRLRVRIDWPEHSRTRPVLVTERPDVDADSTLQLVIRQEPAVLVKGRLVAGEERRPVDGAMVSIRSLGSIDLGAHVESDANGEFEARAIAGEVLVQVYVHGKIVGDDRQFDYPPIKQLKIPEGVEEFQLDDIVLQPQAILVGKLLRSDGSPGGNASVGLRRGDSFRHLSGRTTTEEDGKFRMPVSNWKLRDERLPKAPNEWLLISQPDSPQETPTRMPLKVVSEEPLVLQEN